MFGLFTSKVEKVTETELKCVREWLEEYEKDFEKRVDNMTAKVPNGSSFEFLGKEFFVKDHDARWPYFTVDTYTHLKKEYIERYYGAMSTHCVYMTETGMVDVMFSEGELSNMGLL